MAKAGDVRLRFDALGADEVVSQRRWQRYVEQPHQTPIADFILNDHQPLSDMQFERALQTVTSVILRGIGLEP